MHVLILNARDITNPAGGSAEVLLHEMAKRWVSWGHHVTWFSTRFEQAPDEETINGIDIVRRGNTFSKMIPAFWYYKKYLHGEVDIIIDVIDRLPFFSKLYAPRKTVLLAKGVVGKRASELYPFPLSLYWSTVETFSLLVYQNSPTFVLSASVKQEIVRRGSPPEYITILPRGVSIPASFTPPRREAMPTFIYLGKVNQQKGALDALEAFRIIRQSIPTARLWFVGLGEDKYIQLLRSKVSAYQFGSDVSFFGFVSDDMKFELLARAHVLIIPSRYEAWGLTIPEAGSMGTPVVAYSTAGLQNLIDQNKSGILVEPDPAKLAGACVIVMKNPETYASMQQYAKAMASQYNWDHTAQIALAVIEHISGLKSPVRISPPPASPPANPL